MPTKNNLIFERQFLMIYLVYPLCGIEDSVKNIKDAIYLPKEKFEGAKDYVQYALQVNTEYRYVFIDATVETAEYCNSLATNQINLIIPHVSMYEEWKQRASDKRERTKSMDDLKYYGHIVDFFAGEIYEIGHGFLNKIQIRDKNDKIEDLII